MARDNIRNFCIIAHIDHGKSTLSDRILELTKSVDERTMEDQILDNMDIERERGITIKARAVTMNYTAKDGKTYEFNLIDTPGHVDFAYEVSRSLAACEGAILVVDATQGVEAQTLANTYMALEHDLELVPILNKIDLPSAHPDEVAQEVEDVIGLPCMDAPRVSAKTGLNIDQVLERVVSDIPAPTGDPDAPLKALIFDSIYDSYKGVIVYIRVFEGTVKPGDTIPAGTTMSVEFVRVNHSIPDACAFAIRTPAGLIVHTGDFKVDFTPISGEPIDLVRFGELGSEGVLALLSDSTNAEKPGSTPSERIVGESFEKLFERAANKRIIIATFASNVHRIQQVVDTAVRFGRKVAVFGRSMVNVVAIAQELGYLTIPAGVLIDADNLKDYTDEEIVLITTGSQGEPMSALTRMSIGSHRNIKIGPNDCIIISATPIPGNEKSVGKVVNELMKLGADVIYERMYDVHVSGHACQDETRLLLSLTQPRFFMPMHGEYKHLMKNAGVGASMGIPAEHIIISDIGKVVETDGVDMKITGMVPSGRVLVDGLGVGDVGSVVLRDRKLLADDGLIVVVCAINDATGEVLAGPDLVSRGFVYVRDNEDLMADATVVVRNSLEKCKLNGFRDWATIKGRIRDELGDFIASRTRRKPVILPIIQEV